MRRSPGILLGYANELSSSVSPALGKIRLSWVFSVFLVTGKLLGKRAILFGPRIAIRQSDQQSNQLTLPPSAGFEKNALELRAHGFPSDIVQHPPPPIAIYHPEEHGEFDLRVSKAEKTRSVSARDGGFRSGSVMKTKAAPFWVWLVCSAGKARPRSAKASSWPER